MGSSAILSLAAALRLHLIVVLCSLLLSPALALCRTRVNTTYTSDKYLPTKIYSWTNRIEYLEDVEGALKSALVFDHFDATNQAIFCEPYLAYLNASDDSSKFQWIINMSQSLSNGVFAGYGIYLATDPFVSASYGRILMEIQVPPGKLVASCDYSQDCQVIGMVESVLSSAEAVTYEWFDNGEAMAVRDISLLTFPNGSIVARTYDLRILNSSDFPPPKKFADHNMLDLSTVTTSDFIAEYDDWLHVQSAIFDTFDLVGDELSFRALSLIIELEIRNCRYVKDALVKRGFSPNLISDVSDYISGQDFTPTLPFSRFLEIVVEVGLLDASDAKYFSDLETGDLVRLSVVSKYRNSYSNEVAKNMVAAIYAIKSSRPTINTWAGKTIPRTDPTPPPKVSLTTKSINQTVYIWLSDDLLLGTDLNLSLPKYIQQSASGLFSKPFIYRWYQEYSSSGERYHRNLILQNVLYQVRQHRGAGLVCVFNPLTTPLVKSNFSAFMAIDLPQSRQSVFYPTDYKLLNDAIFSQLSKADDGSALVPSDDFGVIIRSGNEIAFPDGSIHSRIIDVRPHSPPLELQFMRPYTFSKFDAFEFISVFKDWKGAFTGLSRVSDPAIGLTQSTVGTILSWQIFLRCNSTLFATRTLNMSNDQVNQVEQILTTGQPSSDVQLSTKFLLLASIISQDDYDEIQTRGFDPTTVRMAAIKYVMSNDNAVAVALSLLNGLHILSTGASK